MKLGVIKSFGSLLLMLSLGGCGAGTHEPSSPSASPEPGPASVRTVLLTPRSLTEEIEVQGESIAGPGAVDTLSVSFEARVKQVWVSQGEAVEAGELLMEIEPSPATLLELERNQRDLELARQKLDHVQQRLRLQLATNTELLSAQQAVTDSQLALDGLLKRGVRGSGRITADEAAIINRLHVSDGALVPAGGPLIDLLGHNELEILLGVELEDVPRLGPGVRVVLSHAQNRGGKAVTGVIRKVSKSVEPRSRLVDVFVAPNNPKAFRLGESVIGTISIVSRAGWVVPRSALLLDKGEQFFVMTVEDNVARRREVVVGLETPQEVEVFAPELKKGVAVVVQGNYSLRDGMPVRSIQ